MREKVAELLEENRKLPEAERMDENEFELDVEEQQRRVHEGLDREDDLRFELKAWQMARSRVGQKIRKKVWDDMDVVGRSIKGMKVTPKVCFIRKFLPKSVRAKYRIFCPLEINGVENMNFYAYRLWLLSGSLTNSNIRNKHILISH